MEPQDKQIITIEGKEVQRLEYKGQPVVTTRMIDELHQRPEGTSGRSFRQNRRRLVEGDDYFEVPYDEWKGIVGSISSVQKNDTISETQSIGFVPTNFVGPKRGGHRRSILLFTQNGYLMLAKSLTDDLAWKVQRQLVNVYFAARTLKTRFSALSPEDRALVDANAWREIALESTRRIEEKVSAIELHLRDLARAVPDESRSELTDFFRDTLEVELGACVEKARVYSAYRLHCETNRSTPLSKSAFMKALYDLKPRLRPTTRTIMGKKIPHIKNVKLKKGVLAPSHLPQSGEVSDE